MSKKNGKWEQTSFDVTGEASAEVRHREKEQAPLVQPKVNFGLKNPVDTTTTWPAVYGVDLEARRREKLLRDITTGTLHAGGEQTNVGQLLGERQVMLDDKTTSWLLKEQDRLALINKDKYFEDSAHHAHLFETPHGLEYLHKIKPDYFERRMKLAKWVANAQLKLYDLAMNGIHTPADFDFAYMLQSLTPDQKAILKQPIWMLNQANTGVGTRINYSSGIFAKVLVPKRGSTANFAGVGGPGSGVAAGTSSAYKTSDIPADLLG